MKNAMELTSAVRQVLGELDTLIDNLADTDYRQKIGVLNDSTIGQHVRHIVEFFICLNDGYESGAVDYDRRARDKRIETDKEFARQCIHSILRDIDEFDHHQAITLQMSYDKTGEDMISIMTSYQRELAYNIEHSVHHMALIRIGVMAIAPAIELPKGFGVAVSTIRFHDQKSGV
jgi:hypothetical protein